MSKTIEDKKKMAENFPPETEVLYELDVSGDDKAFPFKQVRFLI